MGTMEVFLKGVAISLEVALLTAILYHILNGVKLTVLDLGIGPKYQKAIAMGLISVGFLVVVFFVGHLISLYPTI